MAKAEDYIEDVRRYDADADIAHVEKIVKHLGIALAGKDSSLVSSSDPEELARVREKWCTKKLELDDATGTALVDQVAEQMKGDRNKERVTFYYLVAKHAGKLASL